MSSRRRPDSIFDTFVLLETAERRAELLLGHPCAPSCVRDPAAYLIEFCISGHSN